MPEKSLYRVKATCRICRKDFQARYNVAHKARTCTKPTHKCRRLKKAGKIIVCVEKCCRSQYKASASAAAMDNAIDPRKVLSREEFDRSIKVSLKLDNPEGIAIRFIAWTGCRLGEAMLVRREGVSFPDGPMAIAKVPTLKRRRGRPERSVYLDSKSPFSKELRAWVSKMKPGELIFDGASRRTIQRSVERILKKVKPDREGLVHIFRHTRASMLIKSGAKMSYVRQQLGWQSLELLKIYDHTEKSEVEELFRRMR